MKLRVAMGADHAGFALKQELVARIRDDYDIVDMGARSLEPGDDYPDFAEEVGNAVASGKCERGILICGSGVGACVAANKIAGVRACLCHDTYSAHQGVEHDDMNLLCLGARIVGTELAIDLVNLFLTAKFSGEERHRRRLQKVLDIERKSIQNSCKISERSR